MDDLDKTIPPQRSAGNDFDVDKTIPPQRPAVNMPDMDKTMPGHHDRKTDGRFAVGDLIMGRYKVLAELGQGGMGVVYKCFDETAGIEVALKALPPELSHNTLEMEDIKDNFQLVHNLHHPNIASSNNLERNPENGNYYLIMECCEGEDLRRWIKRKRRDNPLTLNDVLPVIRQVADALDYAHAQKIIHRDIKPGNIMIDGAGNVKVLDFGLAAQIHTSMTRVSMAYHGTSGTGPYMAPEQWRGRAQGAAADQYALAVMAYEMLAGRLPFESTDPAVLKQAVLDEMPDEIPDLSAAAQAALNRAMSKEAADRFNSCADFAVALTGGKVANVSRTKSAVTDNGSKIVSAILQRIGIKWIAAGAVVILVALIAWLALSESDEERLAREALEREREEERMDTEHAELLTALEKKKEKIEYNYYHRLDENFKKQWQELEDAEKTAGKSTLLRVKVKDMREAVAAADWILTNAPKREDARKLIEAENARKSAADQYEPMTFAKDLYTAAGANMTEGKAAYEKGDFGTALPKLQAGLDGYAKAKEAAYQSKLKFHLDEAETAKKNGDWAKVRAIAMNSIHPLDAGKAQTLIEQAERELKRIALAAELKNARTALEEKRWDDVRTFARAAQRIAADDPDAADLLKNADEGEIAQLLAEAEAAKEGEDWETALAKVNAVLEIKSGNQAAVALKNEAETHLVPTLQITATVDGANVPATVKIGADTWSAGDTITNLKEDSSYTAHLSYRRGETEYTGELSFSCNWKGEKQKTVVLKKVEFTGVVTLPGGVQLKMIKVEPGSFMMGSENGESDEKPVHRVTLTKPYYLGETEVTQAQWRAVMGNNPSHFQGDSRPVEKVSWDDAMAFCRKLNDQGKAPKGWKFTLPTEAQWEYACRAGTTTNYSYGDASDVEKMNFDGNYPYGGGSKGVYRQETVAVKSLGYKNAWGFYDMHGNVYEWCLDWYGSRSYSSGAVTNPQGPDSGSYRVLRGGGWSSDAQLCRSAFRDFNNPDYRRSNNGFRLALVPVQ